MTTHFSETSKDPSGIRLTAEELWFLLGLYAPANVIGIENPYIGKMTEEIEIAEQFALQALLARQRVRTIDNNSIELTDSNVKSLIETCLRPVHCLWLVVSRGWQQKNISQRLVYFSIAQAVDAAREGDQAYWLTAVRDIDTLQDLLEPFLSPDTEDQEANSDFIIEQTVFDAAVKGSNSGDDQKGRKILSEAGMNEHGVEELIYALGEDCYNILAIYVSNPSHPDLCHMQGLGYLKGRRGGWILKEYEQNGSKFVNFQSGTAKEFRELTFSMIR